MTDESHKPHFDPTFNIGHLLTAGTIAVGIIGAYFGLDSKLGRIDDRVTAQDRAIERMAGAVEKLTAVTIITARQDERMDAMGRRIESVERRIERAQ